MLNFVLGKSGTGKTTLIYNRICELVHSGNDKIIMIVPDQSSFETEKAFLDLLGAKDSKNVLVFGFSRLCSFVFEQTGKLSNNVIDNGTRAVVMSLAIEQLTEKLKLLGSNHSKSIVDVMLKTITELKKCSVSSDALRLGAASVKDKTLKTKLLETALIADAYDALVAQSFIDPLDDLKKLFNILSENNIFDDFTIFYDGFSGFTVQQLKVIRLLMSQCRDTYVSLTLDPLTDGKEDVFATSQNTYKILKEYAKRDGIDIKAPVKTTEALRFKSSELKVLENGIFRNDYDISSENPKNIMIYEASDINAECEFVAQQIKKLIIYNDYQYSDISIICHDTNNYNGVLDEMLEKYDIPYFMDKNSEVSAKPVIRLVSSIFKVILNGFERDNVMSVLKTGLTSNTVEDISIFENYVYVWNINRSGFKKEFLQNPRGFSDKFTENDKNELAIVERVRKSVAEPLIAFEKASKDKNGKQLTELLYGLLIELGAPDALRQMYESFEKSGEKLLGAEQIKIWNMLIEIFDKMVAVIGNMSVSLSRYYELLTLQISEVRLASIPQTMDSVAVTTAQRVRLPKQKAAFLIGCVDGEFPSAPSFSGIFSSFERKQLAVNDISFGDDLSSLSNLETFMAYCCMTSSSEKLYISYPRSDLQGNSKICSEIVNETKKLFTNIICYDALDFDSKKDAMLAVKPAFEIFSKSLANSDKGLNGLLEFFEADDAYKTKISSLKRARDKAPFSINDKKNAENLFGRDLRISASQIEKFNQCRFYYFCNYGLNIRQRLKAEINPLEYGTLVHYILEKFFSTYTKSEYSEMKEAKIYDFVNEVMNDYLSTYFGGEDSKTLSFLYRLEIIRSNVCLLLAHIIKELTQSDFNVVDCELKIGTDIPAYTIKLPDGHNIAICGSVDRVDVMVKDGIKYLRIIDYKTGPKEFKLSDIIYGLNLQMLLYLSSIEKYGAQKYGKITPGGILYMPATVPIITSDGSDDEKLYESIYKKLTMNGLLLNDVEVIRGMDKSESGKYIPVKIKLDTPVSHRSLATLEDFSKIFAKLENIVKQMGNDLYSGNIKASPVKGAHDACKYCPYDSVCAYHKSEPVNTFDIDNEEVLRKITEEMLEEGENI